LPSTNVQVKEDEMGRAFSIIGEKGNACSLLVVKRSLGKPQCRWLGNIKMDVGKIGWSGVDWIVLAWDRDQWRVYQEINIYFFWLHKSNSETVN
jgi:hypothetical protein